ncbi:hypothetical protein OHB12_33030 [Nocardia sp. NBC_01730]|uniref:hypothetical protein n=1 Tax=Nocardia sp. NBC_01730 TaxID=2975998 RepID=UPI002E15FFAC|nr:hypothetical protein OHB12_33030 [Nocardia sp. NBC_01730]
MLHISSPFSLARGALENLSIAYWILHPAARADRVQHALRWWAQNYLDAERALRPVGGIEDGTTESALLQLKELARRTNGVTAALIRKGHSSSVAVKYTNQHAVEAEQVLFLLAADSRLVFRLRSCEDGPHYFAGGRSV